MKIEWTKFTKSFASKRAAKFGVFFLVFGTSLLLPLDSAGAVATGPVKVICAKPDGEQREFTPSWDNANQFFDGKGQISRLFCEGGYAGEYRVFVSNNLTDPSLDYYNGIAPVVVAPVPVETQTPQAETPTAPSVPEPESSTVQPEPVVPDSSTAPVSDTPTVPSDTPTAVVPESPTVVVPETPTVVAPETPTVVVPETSTPISEPAPQPTPPVQEPSPTPAPVATEPVAVVPQPVPAQPEPAPAPEIEQPAPEPVEPPAPEPAQPEPVEPEPAPPVPADPAPVEPLPADPEPIPAEPAPNPEPVQIDIPTNQEQPSSPIPSESPSPAPVSISEVNVATLPPETPVELENGVILTAEVVVALQLLENPAELLGAIFSDPGQALTALGNIGADMSPEVREKSEKVVISAIIAGGIATQAAGIAAASTYRRNP